jgi:lysophospholipase L1-like esterase
MTHSGSSRAGGSRFILIATVSVWLAACGGKSPTAPESRALTISCPAAITMPSPDDGPVQVSFGVPATDGGTPPVNVTCAPASDSAFPVGTTSVACTATDTRARTSACSFAVTVRPVPRLTATRFMAFGDSLTEGVVSPPGVTIRSEAYPVKLQAMLTQRYTKQSIVVLNEGRAGEYACCDSDVSSGGRRRLPGVLASQRPDVMLLMEGSNDLLIEPDGFTRGISALEQMVAEGKNRGTIVLLATIPPQRSGGARHRDRVAALVPRFNDEIRSLAARQSVALVDVYAAIEPDLQRLIGPDDLHLSPDGYTVIAQRFFDAIQGTLEVMPAASRFYGR